jgi:microcystin-dependent protein
MAEPFLSEIRMMSFVFPPKGWALCDGQLLPINQNMALFSLLGTTYAGDGRVNFGLPDLRGRTPIHMGSYYGGPTHTLGERGGEQAHTLIASETGHGHDALVSTGPANQASPSGNVWASGSAAVYGDNMSVAMAPSAVTSVGGSQAHTNLQPFLTISFCIALQGIFPSQT